MLLKASSPRLTVLKDCFPSGLRSLVISIDGADSVSTVQGVINSMQNNLLGGATLVEAFPGLKSLTLSACAGEPEAAESVEEDDFVLQLEEDDSLEEVKHNDFRQCRYDLNGFGYAPPGAVLATDCFPLPNGFLSYELVEMRNINDPAVFNLKSLRQSGVKSFSIFPVTTVPKGHSIRPNGMTADHLELLPDCLERLALIKSDRFDCWHGPVQWPQCLTVLELCQMRWKPGAPSLPPRLKSLIVSDSSGLMEFDLSWLPESLESLCVDKPLREMGPFPPDLKFMSMFAGPKVIDYIEAPEAPLPNDPVLIQALADQYLASVSPRMREYIVYGGGDPRLIARLLMQNEAIENASLVYSPFVLDLDKLPSSLQVLVLTGITVESDDDIRDLSDRLHVSGQFERLINLQEVRNEHQGVLDYVKEQGLPCTSHLKFVRV